MTIMCPRCGEQVDGVPDGCRDPSCPRAEIEDALEKQAAGPPFIEDVLAFELWWRDVGHPEIHRMVAREAFLAGWLAGNDYAFKDIVA